MLNRSSAPRGRDEVTCGHRRERTRSGHDEWNASSPLLNAPFNGIDEDGSSYCGIGPESARVSSTSWEKRSQPGVLRSTSTKGNLNKDGPNPENRTNSSEGRQTRKDQQVDRSRNHTLCPLYNINRNNAIPSLMAYWSYLQAFWRVASSGIRPNCQGL